MITQRLILDGYPDGIWTCPGCHAPLTSGVLQHPDDCPELHRRNVPGSLPSPAQVCAWLEVHGWTKIGAGEGGSAWTPPGLGFDGRDGWVGVPDDAGDVHALGGALEHIASRSGVLLCDVLAGMRATGVGEESDV